VDQSPVPQISSYLLILHKDPIQADQDGYTLTEHITFYHLTFFIHVFVYEQDIKEMRYLILKIQGSHYATKLPIKSAAKPNEGLLDLVEKAMCPLVLFLSLALSLPEGVVLVKV
jgi:hypothetical protein